MAHGTGTADVTLSTTGNFPESIVDAYIKKRILDHGVSEYRFRAAAQKDPLPAGNGTNIKFVRYNRLVVPTELTEGVPPDADQLEVETVTGQCKQFGQVVEISDVLELTMWHPVVKKAMEELAESAARKDDAIIQNILINGSNVQFGDDGAALPGGIASTRAGLTGDFVLTTRVLRQAISNLEMGGVVGSAVSGSGGAKSYEDGLFLGILNRRCTLDLMDDSVWSSMAERQDKAALESGEIYKWSKCKFLSTNFSPEITGLSAGTATNAPGTDGTMDDGVWSWGFTKTRNSRGLEEVIAAAEANITLSGGSPINSIEFKFPVDATSTYSLYLSSAAGAGDKRLVARDIVGLGTSGPSPDSYVATAAASSTAPTIGAATDLTNTVFINYVLGSDAYAVVDLSSLKTLVSKGAQKSDPLDQLRTMGTKFFMTALILNNAFMVRIEANSHY